MQWGATLRTDFKTMKTVYLLMAVCQPKSITRYVDVCTNVASSLQQHRWQHQQSHGINMAIYS